MSSKDRINEIIAENLISELVFVDVGAQSKLDLIPNFNEIMVVYGFEPNVVEFNKLQDVYKNNSFLSLSLNCLALSDHATSSDFTFSKHSSMSSFREVDIENYKKHFGSYPNFKKWIENISTEVTEKVECTTLDSFFKNKVEVIDFLKLDTQGTELEILKGGLEFLTHKKINILKLEVSTIPIYKNQFLFSDIDLFLRNLGYELVDFISYRDFYQPVNSSTQHYAPCGDAIYVLNDQFLDEKSKIKTGLILSWLGYKSLSKYLLQQTKVSQTDQMIIEGYSFQSSKSKLKKIIKNFCPPFLIFYGKKVFFK